MHDLQDFRSSILSCLNLQFPGSRFFSLVSPFCWSVLQLSNEVKAVAFNSREDHRKKHAPAEVDEDGKEINPHGSYSSVFGYPQSKRICMIKWLVLLLKKLSRAIIGPFLFMGNGNREDLTQCKNGEFHEDIGVIPRAVELLFDTLEAQNAEYSMKVTYIELYKRI